MAKLRIGDILLHAGLIDEMQLNAALAHQRQWAGRLGDALVEMGFIDEMFLWKALSRQLNVPLVHIPEQAVQPGAVALIPADVATKHEVFPLRDDGKEMMLAMADPTNMEAIDEIQFRTGRRRIKPLIAPLREILWAIGHYMQGDPRPCPPPRTRRQLVVNDEEFVLVHEERGEQKELSIPVASYVPENAPTPNLNEVQLGGGGQLIGPDVPPPTPEPPRAAANPVAVSNLRAELDEQTRTLRVLIESCIRRGYFTRDDYLAKLRSF